MIIKAQRLKIIAMKGTMSRYDASDVRGISNV